MLKKLKYFTKEELLLWGLSMLFITTAFLIFDRENYITLIASLIGSASLIYSAKGNPTGPLLMIIFSILYGIISYTFSYYGEMITYMGMTLPMSVIALIAWLKNPYKGNKSEVTVNKLSLREIIFMLFLSIAVTAVFYFILRYLNTANLLISTLSVTTSFIAVYLTFRRSPYFALVYALNDAVLIALWIMAAFQDVSYICVIVCFIAFFINDIYGFYNWRKMYKRQTKER